MTDITEEPIDLRSALRAAVRTAPDQIAVASERGRVTYRELDEWSDDLAAAWLAEIGTGPEPVVIAGGHDEWVLAAFTALAKVGRPSVILDTTTPVDRMAAICGIAGPVAIAADPLYRELGGQLAGQLAAGGCPVLEISARGEYAGAPVLPEPQPEAVLTIIFTSGSTGLPKGVVIGDRPLVSFQRINHLFGGERERIACPVPLSFIFGCMGFVRAVVSVSELHLYDPRRSGIAGLLPWIDDHRLTVLGTTPFMVRSVLGEAIERGAVLDSLRVVLLGGEAALASDVHLVRRVAADDCVVYNGFGSSEAWGVTALALRRGDPVPETGWLSVGRPYGGREVSLFDDHGNRVEEPGRAGVIAVAADEMAWGYWQSPEMTAERFTSLPDGRTQYWVGDVGRWDESGNLVYLGRADLMLKIRGYLVEPAEVESHLRAGGEVGDCVVVGVVVGHPESGAQQGRTRLVAYVVPDPTVWLSSAALRRRLTVELPSYMVPTQFVELPALPRNANGKVDRGALPEPPAIAAGAVRPDAGYGLHRVVADICGRALGLDSIGLDDDLFALGADSLTVEEILAALDAEVGLRIDSATLMQHPTVAEIARLPRRTAGATRDGVLVPLVEGAGDPVFLVAGGGGLALALRDLARGIAKGRPVYGLQARGLEGGGLPDLTARAAARRYVAAIRTVQPHGPYRLLGHSMGALIGYEVVRMLLDAGERVAFFGLLDPPAEGRARFAMRNRAGWTAPAAPAATAKEPLPHTLGELRVWVGRHHPYASRSYWRSVRAGHRFALGMEVGRLIRVTYRLPKRPVAGVPVVLYAATSAAVDARGAMNHGWFAAPPAVVEVDGDHITMLRRPYVEGLAAAVAGDLSTVS